MVSKNIMKKIDTRKIGEKAQQQLRYIAVRRRIEGISAIEIAKSLDVHASSVRKWWRIYKEEGSAGLILKKRGAKPGTNLKLNFNQLKILKDSIIDHSPSEFKIRYLLWTRKTIKFLIFKMWNINIPLRTISDYMKRLGFTPQKPLKRAYQQNPKAVKKWIDSDYPKIYEKSKIEKANIHWVDETGIRSDCNFGRSYSQKGKTPTIITNGKKIKISLVSSITNQGEMSFMAYEKTMNSQKFIEFLESLIKSSKKKVFVISDNLKVHHSKIVKEWANLNKEFIELFYLPSYAPDLNPDEYLNQNLKKIFYSGFPVRNINQLKRQVLRYMKKSQRSKVFIKSLFKHKKVKYAA